MGRAMRCLGQFPTDFELEEIMNEVEKNGKNTIDFPQLLTIMAKSHKLTNDKEPHSNEAFAIFNREGKGYILS